MQLKKDNIPAFVVEWCKFEGSPDFSSLNASHSVSPNIVAESVLGNVALTCWDRNQDPEYYARTRPMTCVADTHSRAHGAGTLTVSAIEGAQMAAARHSHTVFIDCRGDPIKGRRGQDGSYDLLRGQIYFHIVWNRLSKLNKRGEFKYSGEFEETIAPALAAIRGQKSLCHCISGASRSIGFVAGVLVGGVVGLEPQEAFAYLAQIRGIVDLGAMDEEHAHAVPTLEHYKHRWRRLCAEMGLTATIRRVVEPEDAKHLLLDAFSLALAAPAHSGVAEEKPAEEKPAAEEPAEEEPAAEAKRDHGTVNLHAIKERALADCGEAHQAIASAPLLQEGSVVTDDEKPPRSTSEVETARGGPCHASRGAHEVLVAAVEDGGVGQEGSAPAPRSHKRETSDDRNALAAAWHDERRLKAAQKVDAAHRWSPPRAQGVGLGRAGWHASGVQDDASSFGTQGQVGGWEWMPWEPWEHVFATDYYYGAVAGSPSSVVDAQAVEIRDDTDKTPIVEWTALHQAYNTYDEESVRRLLFAPRAANCARAVAPSGHPCEGSLPLHIAAFRHRSRDASDASLLERLVTLTPCLDAPNKKGQTALHLACAQGNVDLVRLLLDGRADPNILWESRKGDFVSITDIAKKSLSYKYLWPLLRKVRDWR